ncbi:YebG family protein [uncultured Photobacterium sp.]|uniref:YebG family protein n=1 Tax=uncultured Photobacterium sp. TaxID=173973 RepID=UPI0026118668|nr:YebG family protein [uncultured Photobacterium sp.]
MAVIVKYVVERNGEEKMTFTSKSEADAYDKMLDMADEMFTLLSESELFEEDEAKQEELSLFLAQKREEVLIALGAKKKAAPKKKVVKPEAVDEQPQDDAA